MSMSRRSLRRCFLGGAFRVASAVLCASLALLAVAHDANATASWHLQASQGSAQDVSANDDSISGNPRKSRKPKRRSTRARRPSRSNVSRGEIAAPRAPVLTWSSPHGADALASDLGAALTQHTRRGQWGVIVVSLSRGDTLFESNPDAMMQPASTMKMYTSVLALDRFGPDHHFATTVLRDGQLSSDGVLQGNLYLRGDGDPSLSPRFWGTLNPMDSLAHLVVNAGVRRVRGNIVGDATAFDNQLVPDGWQSRYLGAAYAARVSALSLDENLVWVVVQPNGKRADITLDPATTTIPVHSTVRVTGGRGGRISAVRQKDGSILVRGSIGASSGPLRYSLVVDDPASFTTGALRAALEKAGVVVDGNVTLGATPATAAEVAGLESAPL